MNALNQLPPFWEILLSLLATAALVLIAVWGFRRTDRSVELSQAREEGAQSERDSSREEKLDAMVKTLEEIQRVQKSIFKQSNAMELEVSKTAILLGEHIKYHERRTA